MVVTQGTRTAEIVAESLFDWGVEVIFGLPGDGINGFIEALRRRKDRIKFVLVRHEESAAFMACAYAKYTGKLGACVATSARTRRTPCWTWRVKWRRHSAGRAPSSICRRGTR